MATHNQQYIPKLNRKAEPLAFDHPKLSAVMSHLKYEFASYKYTVYRCASKIVTLQKVFYTSSIPYKLILAVLERYNITHVDPNYMVPPFQLTSLIHDMYFACEKLGHFTKSVSYNLETATAVLSDFFWNIFDPHRRHSISPIEIKVTFLLLCKIHSSEQLVDEFFQLVRDKSDYVTKYSLKYLLLILSKIMTYLEEGTAYGEHNVPTVLDQCFSRCQNIKGINQYQFHCLWSTSQTRFLIYANLIALVKRIEDTEKLIHNNVCASCHSDKIIGIRFKCQTCKNLSLCMKCFATGFASNKHENGHRMYEVFTEDLPPKKLSHYFAKLCNIFFQRTHEESTGFCNTNDVSTVNETELVTIDTKLSDSVAAQQTRTDSTVREYLKNDYSFQHSQVSSSSSSSIHPSNKLQSIIDKLLQQNAKIEMQLKCIQTSSTTDISNFLNAHQEFLVGIINEMRSFTSSASISYPTSSTPNRAAFAKKQAIDLQSQNLSRSLHGADINRSYLDANKSDYSVSDISGFFYQKKMSSPYTGAPLTVVTEDDGRDTEMLNFKLLLHKVKEIVDDSYSDNTELAEATQNLENALDNIIQDEERRLRNST
ncbi:dystrobrevin alpha [Episyrphus balteatus]|uniref:dystrobrevin alpha n=1 Tax=Episyrphus balteatus TaxID=286459 RepID=UPI002486096F|nr:dystrobrevin alpha [Episyrphus balteatus]